MSGARVRVDAVVAVDGGGALSRAEWQERSAAVARGLAGRGVRPGARVGLLFDGRHWLEFAVAHEAVRAVGAVPVLLPPVEGPRSIAVSGATGLLTVPCLAPPDCGVWVDTVACPPTGADLPNDGWLVHAWAPGSPGSAHVLALVRGGDGPRAVAQWPFDPDRFCALVAARHALDCGLTPALAAAVLASGALQRHDLSSLGRVLLSGAPSAGLQAALGVALPGAAVVVIEPEAARRPAGDRAPAAVSQEAMVWHEQFVPGSFNLPCLVRRHQGRLDVEALGRAFAALARRHEPLRSTFTLTAGRLGQVVHPPGPVPLPVVDVSSPAFWLQFPTNRRATAAKAEVEALLADASRRPFDLVAGPLFEPRLVRLGDDDHLLVVRLHHTVFDDWSVDLFRRELSALYAAAVARSPAPLVEPATTFTAASRRERERLAAGREAEERAWWRRELAGAPLAVQLPLGTGSGEPVRIELGPPLSDELRAAARALRATPFMTALAAFSVLVGRMTGLDDLLLGTVVAHRNESDLEPLIGCFTKKVPLRARLDGDPTFTELVARTRASLLGALAHQDLAFDAAVSEGVGQAAAEHGVVPQVSVVFQGETPQRQRLALPGLVTSPYEPGAASREELHFTATDRDGPVWGDGIYLGTFVIVSLVDGPEGMALVARGVFDRQAGRWLLEGFRSLLAAVVAAPSQALSTFLVDAAPSAGDGEDVIDLRGFRATRSRLEAALRRAPRVADVGLVVGEDRRLVAYVTAAGDPPPTLAELRRALWEALPGAPWPAEAVLVDTVARGPGGHADAAAMRALRPLEPGPPATLLPAMWAELTGRPVGPSDSYWQDFSFLPVLAQAREAGLAVTDEQVVRCRTPEMLAMAMATAPQPRD